MANPQQRDFAKPDREIKASVRQDAPRFHALGVALSRSVVGGIVRQRILLWNEYADAQTTSKSKPR